VVSRSIARGTGPRTDDARTTELEIGAPFVIAALAVAKILIRFHQGKPLLATWGVRSAEQIKPPG
jgi:hypothetical protein